MRELDLEDFFRGVDPVFTRRPASMPGDLRLSWRISVLVLLLRRGRANALALEHLHVLWWSIRTRSNREMLLRWFSGERRPDDLVVRFDPSLTATVDLAVGQRLVETRGATVLLTPQGVSLADSVAKHDGVLGYEKAFLAKLPKSISQRQIRDLLEWS